MPSKIISFILLIDEYVKLLHENKIHIIPFKLSSSSKWNQETLKEYINDLLRNYNKDNIHIGLIDAISHERKTIKSINGILKYLGYPDIDEIKFGFNMINSTLIYEEAETTIGYGSRCMKSFKDMVDVDESIDPKNINFKEQLFNCNLFLFYWYKMKDISKPINQPSRSRMAFDD